jgi:hypothetical protein
MHKALIVTKLDSAASRTRRSSTRLRVFQTEGQEQLLRNEAGVDECIGLISLHVRINAADEPHTA